MADPITAKAYGKKAITVHICKGVNTIGCDRGALNELLLNALQKIILNHFWFTKQSTNDNFTQQAADLLYHFLKVLSLHMYLQKKMIAVKLFRKCIPKLIERQ